ncbi:glucagon-like peptide 2 receptor precursor [Mus musculus]|uniref:Glucagon-like peptide 2 receptor n=3 Tax=Mus musculus TaxID=10090 RepID=GLP2R_MOUSE|nr:glucagon-like peptide 2 receptor precursor [Mus musculus]Q5IXF8.2 RecName: Full=Glucagon-like peptide 2 receptor; Short=GLP-2 receptor; Short=GLP-2-R; Short=GLP-2R [Mus musculus]AAH44746.1 Glucagon-like peptide 2 receptor [Mus musculus]|eukprot:NP_783612.2 glucagon-like peptide 2 receptor precursor [Mus musculus]
MRRLWGPGTPFLALLLLVSIKQVTTGSLLEETVQKWAQYKETCLKDLLEKPSGVFCNGTFDKYVCWPHSFPGNVSVPCPSYLPWWNKESPGRAYRHCLAQGTWQKQENSTDTWQDESECSENHSFKQNVDHYHHTLLSTLQLMYTVGYSLSLISLFLALTLFLFLRKLHCTRNYIHMNLFASFILRALVVLVKDMVFYNSYSRRPDSESGWMSYLSEISASCRSVQVLLHYFVGTNHLWLLVEGLYLHALLEPTVLPERRLWPKYLVVGWAFPMLFVIPWIFVRASLENTGCWAVNENKKIWWIIRGPILLCVTVNFFIFLKILKLLISKFRAHQMCFRDYKYRLAKSTLLLILLMGVHEFLFTFFTDDQVQGFSRLIRLFIQLTLSSFHGFLVALQYGFASREVKAELRKTWGRFLLARHWGCRACVLGKNFRFLGKCSKKLSEGDGAETLQKLQSSGVSSHLTAGNLRDHGAQPHRGRGAWPRASSLSESSEGDFTLANTMEEILEESEI